MKPLRFAWVGFHAEGGPAFEALMQAGAPIHGVITLTPERRARRSGAIDYGPLCARHGVPLHEVADINGPEGLAALGAIQPDVALVIGWSPIVRPPALRLGRIGMIGAPASPLPRRRPADGLIDWCRPSREVYDFIRALTRPYPGAFSWLDGTRWTVWQGALLLSGNGTTAPVEPGTVLGPLVSPVAEACGQMVACGEEEDGGKGVVVLLELEQEDGTILRGRDLSDQLWTGRMWTSIDEHALA